MKGQFFPYKDENISRSIPVVTISLIAINVAVFLWSLADFETIIASYGFIPAGFSLITLLTSMFLHGGIAHIFGNMWFLYLFGDNVEDRMGRAKYIVFYLLAGLAASLAHYITDTGSIIPAIGASGAISGVLGAYLVFFPDVRVHVASYYYAGTVPAKTMIGLWFALQLILGAASLGNSGIAFFAHVGGFIFGYAVAKLFR